jgi:hypothetical protein
MTDDEVQKQVLILNKLLQEKPWLDIDLVECSPYSLVLDCGLDLTVGADLEIRFSDIFLTSMVMAWKTDTSKPVIRVLTGVEAYSINVKFRVDEGYHLFSFQPENLTADTSCIIAAKSFTWSEIHRQ